MDKTALITGVTSGIGLECAKVCAKNGYNLVLIARNEEKLKKIKSDIKAEFSVEIYDFCIDLSLQNSAFEIQKFVISNNLKIDILINNAGFGDYSYFDECDLTKQIQMIQVNITTLIELTYYFVNLMIKNGGGKVLNIASAASLTAGPKMSVYYASKAFVRNFSVALAEELREKNISVTAFCPGPVATNFGLNANVKNAKLFAKSSSAHEVAKHAFFAMQKGKILIYDGRFMSLANFLTRIFTMKFCAKVTSYLNG